MSRSQTKTNPTDPATKLTQVHAAQDMYGSQIIQTPRKNKRKIHYQSMINSNHNQQLEESLQPDPQPVEQGDVIPPAISQDNIHSTTHARKMLETQKQDLSNKSQVGDLEKKGIEQAITEEAKAEVQHKQKFENLTQQSPRILLQIHSVFPFQLFPDIVTVEETRVIVKQRQFFATHNIETMSIADIVGVEVQTVLFFARLRIISRIYVQDAVEPIDVHFLKAGDAKKAQSIIEGLRIITSQGIDPTKLPVEDLLLKVEELGKEH